MTFIGDHKNDFLQLLLVILMGYLLYKMVFLVAYKSYIVANWSDYRCNPMFMPLAGMLNIPDPGGEESANGLLTVKANVGYCLKQKAGVHMGVHGNNLKKNINQLAEASAQHTNAVENTHSWLSSLQNTVLNTRGGIMNRLSLAKSLMNFYMIKFQELFKKLFAVFMTIIYIMKTMENTLKGVLQGPIAQGVDEFVCFTGDTLVELQNGELKQISYIDVNDVLKNDNNVIGIVKSYAPEILYKYDNVIVTGSHLVLEDMKWVKIRDSVEKSKINNRNQYKYVYNLVTGNNMIEINGIKYRDYCECSNSTVNNKIRNYVLDTINIDNIDNIDNKRRRSLIDKYYIDGVDKMIGSKGLKKYDYRDYYLTGFASHTKINMINNTLKSIKDIQVGDELKCDGKIFSVMKYKCENIGNLYRVKGVIMSGYNIIGFGFVGKPQMRWSFASDIGIKLTYNDLSDNKSDDMYLYSIATESGRIMIDNMDILDLNETLEDGSNRVIDEMTLRYLNY